MLGNYHIGGSTVRAHASLDPRSHVGVNGRPIHSSLSTIIMAKAIDRPWNCTTDRCIISNV